MTDRYLKPANPMHSAGKAEWGTPRALVELGRAALGGIDLDPASSSYWNVHSVKAARFFDQRINGMTQPWRGRVFINPPGKVKGAPRTDPGPKAFWEKLIKHYAAGEVTAAVWVGFSLEQLVQLQGSPMHPLQFLTLIPCERLTFLEKAPGNGPPAEGESPTHGNFVTLLYDRGDRERGAQQVRTFLDLANRLDGLFGAVVRPT